MKIPKQMPGLAMLALTSIIIMFSGDYYHSAMRRARFAEGTIVAIICLSISLGLLLYTKRKVQLTQPYLAINLCLLVLFAIDCIDAFHPGIGWFFLIPIAIFGVIRMRRTTRHNSDR